MVTLIAVPYHLGIRAEGVGAGPLRILESRIHQRIGANITNLDLGAEAGIDQVNSAIADAVADVRAAGNFPIVVAGNCNSCLGTLAALKDLEPGIVWFDAHGDFHTKETSISGLLEGMSLTLATERFVPESRVVLAGARDLEPGEVERVRARLCYIPSANFTGAKLPAMRHVYLHLDVDVLDPSFSPGANCKTAGGLTREELLAAIAFTMEHYNVAAFAITNYNPSQDVEYRTRDIVTGILESIVPLRRTSASR